MWTYYFNPTSYVVIDIISSKFHYLNQEKKYQFSFYDSMVLKVSIIFNTLDEIIQFLCRLRYFIDRLSNDPYDANYLYFTNPNEYGDIIEITAHYIPTLQDIPTDEDDNIKFYISKINEIQHKMSIIYSLDLHTSILDGFIEYIHNIFDSLNIDIIPRAETIFTDLLYGDFTR